MAGRRPKYSLIGEMTAVVLSRINEMFIELYSLISDISTHEMLSTTHSDTRKDPEGGVQRGDLITGQRTPQGADRVKWQRLPVGPPDTVVKTSDGIDVEWGKVSLPDGGDVEGVLPVSNGGTGVSSLADNAVLLGNGTDPVQTVVGLGTAAQVLTSNGAGVPPTWEDAGAGSGFDHVVMTTGAEPLEILSDGFGNAIYIPYEP